MSKVLVIGDINIDVVTTYSGDLNQNSDTSARTSITLGGAPSNVSAWLTHCDVSVRLLGAVGKDLFGTWAIKQLDSYGVNTNLIEMHPERSTGTCVILVNDVGERTMLPDPGVNLLVQPHDDLDAAIDSSDILVMSAYSFIRPETREMAVHAVRRARVNGLNVVLDAASAAPIRLAGASLVREWLSMADVVLANEDECRALGSDTTPDWTVMMDNLIMKRGGNGASWYVKGRRMHDVAAIPVEVVDTTGAGDSFLAGIVVSLEQYPSWQFLQDDYRVSALNKAVELAAHCVARVGATPEQQS